MQIVDLKTLMTMPNGTMFMIYNPKYDEVEGSIKVLTGRYKNKDGWNGEISLTPYIEVRGESTPGSYRITNWSTIDTTNNDYMDDTLFAVFDINEMENMKQILEAAIKEYTNNIVDFHRNLLDKTNTTIDELNDRYFCHNTIIIGNDMVKHYDIESNIVIFDVPLLNKVGTIWKEPSGGDWIIPKDEFDKLINSDYVKEMMKNKELFVIDDSCYDYPIAFTSFPPEITPNSYGAEYILGYVTDLNMESAKVVFKYKYITSNEKRRLDPIMTYKYKSVTADNSQRKLYEIYDINLLGFRIVG